MSFISEILIKRQIKSVDKQIAYYRFIQQNSNVQIRKLSAGVSIAGLSLRKKELEDQLRMEKIKCSK